VRAWSVIGYSLEAGGDGECIEGLWVIDANPPVEL